MTEKSDCRRRLHITKSTARTTVTWVVIRSPAVMSHGKVPRARKFVLVTPPSSGFAVEVWRNDAAATTQRQWKMWRSVERRRRCLSARPSGWQVMAYICQRRVLAVSQKVRRPLGNFGHLLDGAKSCAKSTISLPSRTRRYLRHRMCAAAAVCWWCVLGQNPRGSANQV